jgi:hydrogenase maturation protease
MKKLLIIGIGSRIMLDDAIGINLVEDLRKLDTNPYVKYILGETDVYYCIKEVLNYDSVIIIDAFLSGKQPGEITIVPLNELNDANEETFYSMHGVHLLNILRCSKHSPDGILIGIEPYEINYGFTLSDRLQSCYSCILKEVNEYIGNYLKVVLS